MKAAQFWLNLPVKDVSAASQFYQDIGFELNPDFQQSSQAASLFVGEHNIVLMLFPHADMEQYLQGPISSTDSGNEVLFSLSAPNREEVDKMEDIILQSGGMVFSPPSEIQGFMYNISFSDPDGHKWNMMYMDMEALERLRNQG